MRVVWRSSALAADAAAAGSFASEDSAGAAGALPTMSHIIKNEAANPATDLKPHHDETDKLDIGRGVTPLTGGYCLENAADWQCALHNRAAELPVFQ